MNILAVEQHRKLLEEIRVILSENPEVRRFSICVHGIRKDEDDFFGYMDKKYSKEIDYIIKDVEEEITPQFKKMFEKALSDKIDTLLKG